MLNGFRTAWRRVFGRRESLEQGRNRVFESYHEGIRSGQLKPADAALVWERIEQLEQRSSRKEALQGYQYLADYVRALSRSLIVGEPGRLRNLHPQRFQWLYNGVANGLISCDELKMGATMRRLEPQAGEKMRALHNKLWGGIL